MQLFITEYKKNNIHITITDTDLLSQLRKVLRASIGDIIRIQSPENQAKKTRYEVRIETWDNKTVECTIVSEQIYTTTDTKKRMIIAMPNKWDKIELMVQKLTECGLDEILFWPSERSVIKEWNQKKEERLFKIVKEAVEQSWGWAFPEIHFVPDIQKHLQNTEVIVFDKSGTKQENKNEKQDTQSSSPKSHITGIIWPEGGLTYRDYQALEWTKYDIYSLGETVLRTETAAIIWWWLVRNNFK